MRMQTPRFVELPPLLIAGMREPLHEQNGQAIPELWKNFTPYMGNIPFQVGQVAYGLCVKSNDSSNGNFYYMAGCEVSEFVNLPAKLSPIIVPAQKYAVFSHDFHISKIRETIDYVFDKWLPQSGKQHNEQSIHFFERYSEKFEPNVGVGEIEIWVPIF
jgi:AraC family transcriptional regulator